MDARALERRLERLETLQDVTVMLTGTLAPEEVRGRAIEASTRLLECEAASLLLLDEAAQELYFEVAVGEKGAAVSKVRLKVGEGIAGWVAKTGEPELVPDCAKDPRFARRVDESSKFHTRNMICVPIDFGTERLGVLQAMNRLDTSFTSEDLRLARGLASALAIAIDNARAHDEIRRTLLETATALSDAIELRDPYTGGHTKRVQAFAMTTAKYTSLGHDEMFWLELSAILHDIGKIGVEDRILRKPAALTEEEWKQMKRHPDLGAALIEHLKGLRRVIPGMRFHHERPDGRGYPLGLKGDEIPLTARIVAVVDSFDAMTSDRPYRKGMDPKVALEELKRCSGTQFDPEVVRAFLKAWDAHEIEPLMLLGPASTLETEEK